MTIVITSTPPAGVVCLTSAPTCMPSIMDPGLSMINNVKTGRCCRINYHASLVECCTAAISKRGTSVESQTDTEQHDRQTDSQNRTDRQTQDRQTQTRNLHNAH